MSRLFWLILRLKQTLLAALAVTVIIGFFVSYPPQAAKGDVKVEVIEEPQIPNATTTTKAMLQDLARQTAVKYGLNVQRFLATQACEIKKVRIGSETVWDYKAQSDHYWRGVREDSWGAWQIHLPSHKNITKEQAQDPVWSTEWAAQQFAKGKANMWTCWRGL